MKTPELLIWPGSPQRWTSNPRNIKFYHFQLCSKVHENNNYWQTNSSVLLVVWLTTHTYCQKLIDQIKLILFPRSIDYIKKICTSPIQNTVGQWCTSTTEYTPAQVTQNRQQQQQSYYKEETTFHLTHDTIHRHRDQRTAHTVAMHYNVMLLYLPAKSKQKISKAKLNWLTLHSGPTDQIKMYETAIWQVWLSEVRRQIDPDSRSSCTEGSVTKAGPQLTDEKRTSVGQTAS